MTHSLTPIVTSGTFPIDPPSLDAPENLVAVGGNTVTDLTWDAVTGAVSYSVSYSEAPEVWIPIGNVLTYQFTGLTNGVLYGFAVAGVDVDSNRGAEAVVFATPTDGSMTLIDSTDFESGFGSVQDPYGTGRPTIVTSNPHTGTSSLRYNFKDGVTDPITGQIGDNLQTANYWPSSAISANPGAITNSATWEMWFRYDACNWPSGDSINGKLLYMLTDDPDALADTFYLSGSGLGGSSGSINISQNGFLPNWEDRSYGWNGSSGKSAVLYLDSGEPFGPDATWHLVKIEMDYINGGAGYSRMRVAIDGTWCQEGTDYGNVDVNGWFNMPPEMIIHGHRLGYADETAASNTTDGAGDNYAAGCQWDDLKLYEGIE